MHIKMQGLELSFQGSQPSSVGKVGDLGNVDSTQVIAETLRKQEEAMPPDLRADSLMDYDKIINWSSPDQSPDEPPMPLTGEEAL